MSISCPYCNKITNETAKISGSRSLVVCSGFFVRKSDRSRQQRFLCKACKRTFSVASSHPCVRQKKRHLNPEVAKLQVSGVSMRRMAILLNANRKTIIRKIIFLGMHAEQDLLSRRAQCPIATEVEFDDLETFEHSKMKPLSVTMCVETGTRRILGFRVARMPAKGLLAAASRKKYGHRKDERKHYREELFDELTAHIHPLATFKSDEHPHYPLTVKKFFPKAQHKRYKGRRGCVVGQGELKAGGFDPLFSLNHTFAMLRANIHRLFRRTWNTTKKPENLKWQIYIYILFHNEVLIAPKTRTVSELAI